MLNIHPGIFKEAASKIFLLFFRFIFLSFINMYELWLWPREEHKFRIYIFEKSIGAWKTIVVYHIFANHILDTFLQIVIQDYLYANFANCCSVQPFCNLSFSTIYFLKNVANVLLLTLHLKFGSKLSMGLYGAFWAPCDTKQSYAIRGLRHGPICCCSVSMVFWAPSGTKQSYAILGLRHDPICCCSLSVVWLKLWQNIFRYFGWAKFWRKGMIVKAS